MGNIIRILVSAIVTVLGAILLIAWQYELVIIIKGIVPVLCVLGGVIGVVAGLSERKDLIKAAKENK